MLNPVSSCALMLLVLAVASCRADDTPRQSPNGTLLIRGVTLVDVENGDRTPGTSVLIDGATIAAVGPDENIAAPGAEVLDGSGKYLTPGFIDSHVHLFMTWGHNWPDTVAELGWILASGVTTIRDAGGGGDRARLQESYIRLREAARTGRINGPDIVVSASGSDLMRLTGASTLAEALGRFGESGLDQLKVGSMPPEEALERVRLARAAGVTVWGHHSYWPTATDRVIYSIAAVDAGINGLTHGGGIPDGSRVHPLSAGVRWDSPPVERAAAQLAERTAEVDSTAEREWIERVVSHGVWLEPTLAVRFASSALFYGRCTDPVDLGAVRKYYPFYAATVALPLTVAQTDAVRLVCERRFRFLRSFYDAGGKIVAGTDEVPFAPMGVPWGMSLLVLAGLPPLAALQAATINAAEALDLADRVGTIEPGKEADFVLLEGDPVEDIANVRRVSAVIANGRLIDRDALLSRQGTNPPMRLQGVNYGLQGVNYELARLSQGAVTFAMEHPDSVVDMRVVLNDLYRSGDFRGVERWVPADLQRQVGDTLIVRAPGSTIRYLAGVRFVQDVIIR